MLLPAVFVALAFCWRFFEPILVAAIEAWMHVRLVGQEGEARPFIKRLPCSHVLFVLRFSTGALNSR